MSPSLTLRSVPTKDLLVQGFAQWTMYSRTGSSSTSLVSIDAPLFTPESIDPREVTYAFPLPCVSAGVVVAGQDAESLLEAGLEEIPCPASEGEAERHVSRHVSRTSDPPHHMPITHTVTSLSFLESWHNFPKSRNKRHPQLFFPVIAIFKVPGAAGMRGAAVTAARLGAKHRSRGRDVSVGWRGGDRINQKQESQWA